MSDTHEFVRLLVTAGVAGWFWGLAVMDYTMGHARNAWAELIGGALLFGALVWRHVSP
jgi:hypothetical protein